MANQNEPAKLLLPFLQRADELQKHEPIVAYYCRLYAMELGLKIPQSERTKTTSALLMSLISQLEKDKKSLNLSPDDNLHLEGFALNVFGKADKQDRAGRADLNTAKTFYAASIFFEVLGQFGPLAPDLEQKRKYAAWKAADIRKAMKEGRKPQPGGPAADDQEFSVPSGNPNGTQELGPNKTSSVSPGTEPDTRSHFYDEVNHQPSTAMPPPPPPQYHKITSNEYSSHVPPPSVSSYPTTSYPTDDLRPPLNGSETHAYSQPYNNQFYMQDPQQHVPHNFLFHEPTPYSYPNFQSYPSFTESSLPSAPTHHPSPYQSPGTAYSQQSALSGPQNPRHSSSGRNGSAPVQSPVEKYKYDSSYQPSPDKIAEAHKAARFAVGALAFDDVSVAVEHLKKSLELLTNPSAASH